MTQTSSSTILIAMIDEKKKKKEKEIGKIRVNRRRDELLQRLYRVQRR